MKTTESNGLHIEFESIDFAVDWRKLQYWLMENGAEYVRKTGEFVLKENIDKFYKMKAKYIDEPLGIKGEKYRPKRRVYYLKYKR